MKGGCGKAQNDKEGRDERSPQMQTCDLIEYRVEKMEEREIRLTEEEGEE